MKRYLLIILLVFVFPLIAISCKNVKFNLPSDATQQQEEKTIIFPISDPQQRITKKLFGTYVEPGNSPVSPERFTGFHNALDFETFDDEQDTDVDIFAICTGPLLVKNWVSGYGGVIIQSCIINQEDVTVLYGHIDLESVAADINDTLVQGQKIAILGDGFSEKTDNERKHLHLGIHKGIDIDYRGYVQNKADLDMWMDPAVVLGLN